MDKKSKRKVVYVTSSKFKVQENQIFLSCAKLKDGTPVSELFEFEIRSNEIKEMLEVDLEVMVQAEAVLAYSQVKVPCIVEHAGLVFDDYINSSYPGGLTKPMWNALKDNFLKETASSGRLSTARAVVGYCDGMKTITFTGETKGKLAEHPKGGRKFYWDTVFIPNDTKYNPNGMTYAEIVEDNNLGLAYKMEYLSQSSKAMIEFLEYLRHQEQNKLWD